MNAHPGKCCSPVTGRQGRALKGQMIFEFVIATLFFLAIVMYAINMLNTTVSAYSGEHESNVYQSRAWQISEVLARSPGEWTGVPPAMDPDSIGLADETEGWPVLDEGKIASLQGLCASDFRRVMGLLDVDWQLNGAEIRVVKFDDPGETEIMDCGGLPPGIPYSRYTRFGVSGTDGKLLKVAVSYY